MSNYIVTDSELTSVANAIRTKGGTNGSLVFPGGFTSAISNISGGGSSDFSTAEVTIVNETASSFFLGNVIVCFEENEAGPSSLPFIGNEVLPVPAQENKTFNVPLYKGMAIWFNADITAQGTAIGAIVLDDDTGMVYITGNGTITIS